MFRFSIQYLAICIANELFNNWTSPFKPSSILFNCKSVILFIVGAKHNGIFNSSALSLIIFSVWSIFDSIVKPTHVDLSMPALCQAISSIVFPSRSQWSNCKDVIPQATGFLLLIFMIYL